jgi:hypothetical protein
MTSNGTSLGVLRSLVVTAFAATAIASAGAQTADTEKHLIEGVRNVRYCEIIPVVRRGLHLAATVYNTLGVNDCPAAVWDKINEAAMKRRFGALKVMLNGPRHFVMDAISAVGDTAAGKTVEAAGLSLTARATIDVGLLDLRPQPYRERTIARETRYVFKAGKPVFLLVRPDGGRYAMQSYAQIVDKSLSYADLPTLGGRLKLPAGWRYETMTPDRDLIVGAQGKATVVQDDLQNTYQKLVSLLHPPPAK